MKRFNVVRAKKIEGREKAIWLNVGTITQFDNGNKILEMNDRQEVYQIFEITKKEEQTKEVNSPINNNAGPYIKEPMNVPVNEQNFEIQDYPSSPEEENIKVENIPF